MHWFSLHPHTRLISTGWSNALTHDAVCLHKSAVADLIRTHSVSGVTSSPGSKLMMVGVRVEATVRRCCSLRYWLSRLQVAEKLVMVISGDLSLSGSLWGWGLMPFFSWHLCFYKHTLSAKKKGEVDFEAHAWTIWQRERNVSQTNSNQETVHMSVWTWRTMIVQTPTHMKSIQRGF